MSFAAAAALGLALGIVTGMPLGVINVAIIDAAAARRTRHAIGLGLGGGAADTVHATLAFAGVGRLLLARPELLRGLALVAGAAITAYAITAWRRHRTVPHAPDVAASPPPPPTLTPIDSLGRGIASGLGLTLPNPGALGAWVAIAAAVWPDASVAEACTVGATVGAGSMLWFGLLARWIARVRPDHPALRHLPRIALVLLVALAFAGVLRVL